MIMLIREDISDKNLLGTVKKRKATRANKMTLSFISSFALMKAMRILVFMLSAITDQ